MVARDHPRWRRRCSGHERKVTSADSVLQRRFAKRLRRDGAVDMDGSLRSLDEVYAVQWTIRWLLGRLRFEAPGLRYSDQFVEEFVVVDGTDLDRSRSHRHLQYDQHH